MATVHISQDDFDDFMAECDTDPYLPVSVQVARSELGSAQSVVDELVGAAGVHGYRTDAPRSWADQLEEDLTAAEVEAAELSFLVDRI